jgi:glutamate dehydrogenase (NAD(P)+)
MVTDSGAGKAPDDGGSEAIRALDFNFRTGAEIVGMAERMITAVLTPHREVWEVLSLPDAELPIPGPIYGGRFLGNAWRGPGAGGIRFAPDVTPGLLGALAVEMAIKNALARIPRGGAKGGAAIDTTGLTRGQLRDLGKAYFFAVRKVIGRRDDILATDMGTNDAVIGGMMKAASMVDGWWGDVLASKPLENGGSPVRPLSTGLVALLLLEYAAAHPMDLGGRALRPIDLDRAEVALFGFGSANRGFAQSVLDRRSPVRITWIADKYDAIHIPGGADIRALLDHVDAGGPLRDFTGAELCTPDDVIAAPVTGLVAAAKEGVFDAREAQLINARVPIMVGNYTLTLPGQLALSDRGINWHSESYASFGGSLGSFQEVERPDLSLFPGRATQFVADLATAAFDDIHAVAQGLRPEISSKPMPLWQAAQALAAYRLMAAGEAFFDS